MVASTPCHHAGRSSWSCSPCGALDWSRGFVLGKSELNILVIFYVCVWGGPIWDDGWARHACIGLTHASLHMLYARTPEQASKQCSLFAGMVHASWCTPRAPKLHLIPGHLVVALVDPRVRCLPHTQPVGRGLLLHHRSLRVDPTVLSVPTAWVIRPSMGRVLKGGCASQ